MTKRCNQCDQELIEVDNRGERLVACLTCNLWAAEGQARMGETQRGRPSRPARAAPQRIKISGRGRSLLTAGRAAVSFAAAHDLGRLASRKSSSKIWEHLFYCLHAG
jgi:hypothetical protein